MPNQAETTSKGSPNFRALWIGLVTVMAVSFCVLGYYGL